MIKTNLIFLIYVNKIWITIYKKGVKCGGNVVLSYTNEIIFKCLTKLS